VAQGLLLAIFLAAMMRRREVVSGMVLALGVILCVMTLSRYYITLWLLIFLLPATDPRRRGNLALTLGLILLPAIHHALSAPPLFRYHVLSLALLGMLAALALYYLMLPTPSVVALREDPRGSGNAP